MSELKSRLPSKSKTDLDTFLGGAEQRTTSKPASTKQLAYPWEDDKVREDVIKPFNIRLSEPYLLKLKYIAEHTPDSMQKFCLTILHEAINAKIEELTK
jgi:hypothetical protein